MRPDLSYVVGRVQAGDAYVGAGVRLPLDFADKGEPRPDQVTVSLGDLYRLVIYAQELEVFLSIILEDNDHRRNIDGEFEDTQYVIDPDTMTDIARLLREGLD